MAVIRISPFGTSADITSLESSVSTNTSNIALKDAKLIATNSQADDYTLVIGDVAKKIQMTKATANTLTVPPNSSVAFSTGTRIVVSQYGAGQVTITPGSGVTLRSDGGKLKIATQYSMAYLEKIGTNEWLIVGNLTV